MTLTQHATPRTAITLPHRPTRRAAVTAVALGLIPLTLVFASRASAATAPGLGTAGSFSVLAGSGITNTGPTTLFGDIGTFPTPSITGLGSITLGGTNHAGDAVTQDAKSDLTTAYNSAAGALPPTMVTADLGGTTLVPGVYKATTAMGLTGSVTLDAGGNPDAVFIFQAGSTLKTASSSSVVLLNNAQACNVFWQVGSSATFGTSTKFRGNVLAHTSITANTNATFEGRLLANAGAVTLDSNVVTRPGCATTPPAGGGGGGTTPPGGGGTTPPGGGGSTPPGGGGTTPPGGGGSTPPGGGGTTPPGTGGGGGSSGGGSTLPNTGSNDNVGAKQSAGALPNTGGPTSAWLLAGLGLVLAGSLAIRSVRIRPQHRL